MPSLATMTTTLMQLKLTPMVTGAITIIRTDGRVILTMTITTPKVLTLTEIGAITITHTDGRDILMTMTTTLTELKLTHTVDITVIKIITLMAMKLAAQTIVMITAIT